MADLVYMTHQDIEGIAGPVTRRAFVNVHTKKGWRLAAAPDPDVGDGTAKPIDLESLTDAQLRKLAKQRGITVDGSGRDAYLAALSAAPTTGEETG